MAGTRDIRLRLAALAGAIALTIACSSAPPQVVLATTTSMGNSGLLDLVLPSYASARVQPVLVGSGRALDMLGARQADVVISHAPARETEALRSHPTWLYRKILYNDFLIVGPPDDPAGVRSAANAVDAMRLIRERGSRFLSRGDESGTHERERELWTLAGIPHDGPHRVVAGAGMGQTLRVANGTGAYTLTDRGTFEALRGSLELVSVHEGDSILLNTYAVMADSGNAAGAAFVRWLAEGDGRTLLEGILENGRVKGFSVWPRDVPGHTPDARLKRGS